MKIDTYRWTMDQGWGSASPSPGGAAGSTLALVFGASELFDRAEPFAALREALPGAVIAGCSTAGEIDGVRVSDRSASVAVARFDDVRLRFAHADASDPSRSEAAGEEIARALAAPDLRAVLVLSDGLRVNGTALVRGLNAVLGDKVVVSGGLAGDGSRFERTWVLVDGAPVTQRVTAVGLYGDAVRVGHGSKGGWDNFGPERTVTRSEGNVLYELDGKPALGLYKTYLGERASGLPSTGLLFPLAVRTADGRLIVRTILAVDEAQQSLTFAGDIPEGARAQLMRANFDRLVDGAGAAALDAGASAAGGPCLSVAISCVGRRLVLGERIEEEVEATLDALPPNTTQVGFYSYGELSPHASGACELHNQTMTLTTVWEARA
ncbi:MAG: FIST N-terminal domain-containing protein [Polyangiales bacterium]